MDFGARASGRAWRGPAQVPVHEPVTEFLSSPLRAALSCGCPAPPKGRSRSSRTRGRMRWTRQRQARSGALGGFLEEEPVSGETGTLTTALLADGEDVWSRCPA